MLGRTEGEYLKIQIDRAERRLAHQEVAMSRLRFNSSPLYANAAKDLKTTMEDKLKALYKQQRALSLASPSVGDP